MSEHDEKTGGEHDPPEPFDRWSWKDPETGDNRRRKFSDEALLDCLNNAKTRDDARRLAKKHGMSFSWVMQIRSRGTGLTCVLNAVNNKRIDQFRDGPGDAA